MPKRSAQFPEAERYMKNFACVTLMCFLTTFVVPRLSDAKTAIIWSGQEIFCKGQLSEYFDLLSQVAPENPAYLQYVLSRLVEPSFRQSVVSKPRGKDELSLMSEKERLILAWALWIDGNVTDPSQIQSVLDFNSSGGFVESYRLLLLIQMGQKQLIPEFQKSYQSHKAVDSYLLFHAVSIVLESMGGSENLELYRHDMKFIEDENVDKFLIQAYLRVAAEGVDAFSGTYELAKKAYEGCPLNGDAVAFYADHLSHQGRFREAINVIDRFTAVYPVPSAFFDLSMAYLHEQTGEFDRAHEFLVKAKARKLYLDPKADLEIVRLESVIHAARQDRLKSGVWTWILASALALVILLLFLSLFWRGRS